MVSVTTAEASKTTVPDSGTSMEELTKAIKEMELQANELKEAKKKLADLDAKYDKSKMTVAKQGREIKALKEKSKDFRKGAQAGSCYSRNQEDFVGPH